MRNKYFKKFINFNDEQKLVLLKSLDYNVDDGGFIIDKNNKKVVAVKSKSKRYGNKQKCKWRNK